MLSAITFMVGHTLLTSNTIVISALRELRSFRVTEFHPSPDGGDVRAITGVKAGTQFIDSDG